MVAPLTVKTVDVPAHIVALLAVTDKADEMVTFDVAVLVQPAVDPSIVYVVLDAGVARTTLPVELLNVPAGDQV